MVLPRRRRPRPQLGALPGAERWAGGDGDIGVLALHGFTGSPVSMRPLAEALAERGLAVELPLLPGHGTRWQDLQARTWHELADEARAGLSRLRSRTRSQVVVGLSTGGTLALHLAAGDASVAGVVVVNPFLTVADPRLRLLPLLKRALPSLPGVGDDIAKPGVDEGGYPRLPLRAFASTLELLAHTRAALPRITAPTLVFTSRQDHVVSPSDSALVTAGVSSPDVEQRWLERSYHVATLDHDLPEIIDATAAFAARVGTSPDERAASPLR